MDVLVLVEVSGDIALELFGEFAVVGELGLQQRRVLRGGNEHDTFPTVTGHGDGLALGELFEHTDDQSGSGRYRVLRRPGRVGLDNCGAGKWDRDR